MKEQLSREVQRREELEGLLEQSQKEMEDLSVSLFTEANEMVAKARQDTEVLKRELDYLRAKEKGRIGKLRSIQTAVRTSIEARKLLSYSNESNYH